MARSLHQVIAVVKPARTRAEQTLTKLYHLAQRQMTPGPFAGQERWYTPLDDSGEQLPPERFRVQERANDLLRQAAEAVIPVWDLVLTQDVGNTKAKADITVDGKVLVKAVPATTLLYLEKQLINLRTFVTALPVQDPTEEWEWDRTADSYKTPDKVTTRSKKVPIAFEKAKATDKHPAQVEVLHEDRIVGQWHTVKYSGALTRTRSNELLGRIEKLQDAVKLAREEANKEEVTDQKIGKVLLDYVRS